MRGDWDGKRKNARAVRNISGFGYGKDGLDREDDDSLGRRD